MEGEVCTADNLSSRHQLRRGHEIDGAADEHCVVYQQNGLFLFRTQEAYVSINSERCYEIIMNTLFKINLNQ